MSAAAECLSPTYRGPLIPLRWRCARGHEWKTPPQFVRRQHTWCPQCWNGPRKGIGAVRADACAQGGVLLSPRFQGVNVRIAIGVGSAMSSARARAASPRGLVPAVPSGRRARPRAAPEGDRRRGGELLSERCGQSRDRNPCALQRGPRVADPAVQPDERRLVPVMCGRGADRPIHAALEHHRYARGGGEARRRMPLGALHQHLHQVALALPCGARVERAAESGPYGLMVPFMRPEPGHTRCNARAGQRARGRVPLAKVPKNPQRASAISV